MIYNNKIKNVGEETIYLLLLLIISSFEAQFEIIELPQYGSKHANTPAGFYLSLDGFKKGDKLYINLSYDNGMTFENLKLYYAESDDYSRTSFNKATTIEYSYYTQELGNTVVYDFSIELKNNTKYFLIYIPVYTYKDNRVIYEITVSHVKKTSADIVVLIIFIVFGIIIFLAIFIPLLRCIIKRVKLRRADQAINYTNWNSAIQPHSEYPVMPPSY